ncbi:protein phosphatase inhibitor 2-like [Ochotona princeps]|uniref:protein phosphatase inhibitor 2-like n=1 Tax=Ochotona princeps TaxID=9978 RepID=UPI0027154802|nr:protein phosphatase inhibitor 2-like [Ochotona princeps]XP_058514871.1 protein phosphatase inhibitor 2-like [Ochotona princeps]
MASRKHIKGILKNKSSTSSSAASAKQPCGKTDMSPSEKYLKCDEMNMLMTSPAVHKDDDSMEIDEPSTPYHQEMGSDDDEALTEALTPENHANKLAAMGRSESMYQVRVLESKGRVMALTSEQREKKRQFEMKRKFHDNEELNTKIATKLISRYQQDEVQDEEMPETAEAESMELE